VLNKFWFYLSMILVKIGRKDNLIASHLALELYQLLIVVQMLVRDQKKGTNIHRFGDNEDICFMCTPGLLSNISDNGSDTAGTVFKLTFSAAMEMDRLVVDYGLNYPGKSDTFYALYKRTSL